jgi:tetratricopeptide (TPR) repeat protein
MLDRGDLLRASGLTIEVLDCLDAYDVLDPLEGAYPYRDVLIAREVKRLIDRDYRVGTIVQASLTLRRAGVSLVETRLVEAPWGGIVQQVGGALATLDGQFALPFPQEITDADDVFERAEACEIAGDLVAAERLYRRAMSIDLTDAAIAYNLGNVLDAQGRRSDAILAYYQALQRDPDFAEAWLNLGIIEEEQGRIGEAVEHYRAAVSAQPTYAQAIFNLALLLTEQEAYEEAAPFWERFLTLTPHGPDTLRARRCAMLCRLGSRSSRLSPPL